MIVLSRQVTPSMAAIGVEHEFKIFALIFQSTNQLYAVLHVYIIIAGSMYNL